MKRSAVSSSAQRPSGKLWPDARSLWTVGTRHKITALPRIPREMVAITAAADIRKSAMEENPMDAHMEARAVILAERGMPPP